jgi:DNA repair protein SbcC/Rad50
MIPIKLDITNFMSYQGHHELDFTGFHTASIIGSNGSGKSAILDAITWVLFGKSRITRDSERKDGTKERNDIINCYSNFCEVSLEFELEGRRYLVNRRIDRGKTGQGVQFKLLTADGERDLHGKGASDAEIEKELGVSFKVFLTSSFITQGDSSRFMEANPRERREILQEILELDVYERCLEAAADQLKEAKKSSEILEVEQKRLTETALLEPDIQRKLDTATTELDDATRQLELAKLEKEKLAHESTGLDANISALAQDEKQLSELQTEQMKLDSEISKWDSEIAKANSVIATETEIESGYKQYCESKKELDLLNELSVKNAVLEKQIQKIQYQIGLEENNVSNNLKQKKLELTEAQNAAQSLPELEKNLEQAQDQKHAFEKVQVELNNFELQLSSAQKEFDISKTNYDLSRKKLDSKLKTLGLTQAQQAADELSKIPTITAELENMQSELGLSESNISAVKTAIEVTKSEISHLSDEIKLLEQGETGNCPLCGQPLEEDKQGELLSAKKANVVTLKDKIRTIESELIQVTQKNSSLKSNITSASNTISKKSDLETVVQLSIEVDSALSVMNKKTEELEETRASKTNFINNNNKAITDKDFIEKNLLTASHKLEDARSRSTKMSALGQEVSELEQNLANKAFAKDEQAQLETMGKQRSELGFNPALLTIVKDKTLKLTVFDDKKRLLDRAKDYVISANSALEQSTSRFEYVKNQAESLVTKIALLPELRSQKTALTTNLNQARQNEVLSNTVRDNKLSIKNNLERDLKNSREAKLQLDEFSSKLLQNDKEIKILEECKKMFGVEGIPSQILEGVIPELQEMANSILTDISQGRVGSEGMRLQIETIKEGTTKQTKTLGIIITDGQIRRPYELFSGGERFRADFAIRIALSQLLAQRSGRRLRTLVIDEGFGTQDDEGIRRLIEAIQDISDKFDKVLVISHVDELKNAFEKRVLVRRNSETSSFEVM